MIVITTAGEYYSVKGNVKTVEKFTEVVKAPSLEFFMEESSRYMGTDDNGQPKYKLNKYLNVRGKLKRDLLPHILRRKYTDFVRVRKCVIEDITAPGVDGTSAGKLEGLPISLMNRVSLGEIVKQKKIPIDVNDYMDIDELRTDIMNFFEDADTFLKTYKEKNEKRNMEREYLQLNGLLDVAALDVAVTPALATPAPKAIKGKSIIE
jgi:hypothetical protein